jgi:micrococcal nuclease
MKGLLFCTIVFLPLHVFSQLSGKVVSVADGDTFTLLVDQQQIRIRLHGIDCPEKGQDFSQKAKEYLSGLVAGKTVRVTKTDVDRYGRTIGIVHIDSLNINEMLLKEGLAWHYKYYDKNPDWAAFEAEAKKMKRGLWVQPNPQAPWEFRRKAN